MILGGLVAVALITALVAPYFINWGEYRHAFEREASRILGQPVTVAGDATARLLPFPSVTFTDVRIGDTDQPLVVASRFSMDAELAPFLSGEILIFDMRLENPTITLDLDKRGLPVWHLPEGGPVKPAQVTLENASITNATVVLRDPIANRTWRIEELDAKVSAESLYGPFRFEGEGALNGLTVDFRVNTGALSKDGFSLRTALDLPHSGIELNTDGRVAEPGPSETGPYNGSFSVRPLTVRNDNRYVVSGKFSASPRAVDVSEFRGEFGDQADPYVVTGAAGITGGADPRYHIEVKGTQVTLPQDAAGTEQAGAPAGDVTVQGFTARLTRLQAMLTALPFPPVPGSLDVDLPAVIAGDTTIRNIRLKAAPDGDAGAEAKRRWTISEFSAELPGRTTVEADGLLQLPIPYGAGAEGHTGFSGTLVVASRQPSGLATWLTGKAEEPIRRLTNAGVAAKVELYSNRQSIKDLEVILGPARMHGTVERVSDPARRPTLDVKLSGEAIDFDALEALTAVFVGDNGAARFADQDLDVALDLKDPDIRGVRLDALEASIRSRGDRTEIDKFTVDGLFGAAVSATATLERKGEGMQADIDATVVAGDGGALIRGLSARFPDSGPLARLAAIAGRDGQAFSDTRFDVVGTVERKQGLSGEASLSISGESGGTNLSMTSTATGSLEDPEKAKVFMNASLDNPAAEKLLAQAGLQPLPVKSPGAVSVEAKVDGTLFDGMKTTVTLTGDDMSTSFDGVTTSDILSTGFTGQMRVQASDIEPWMQTLGYGLPGMGYGTTADVGASFTYRSGKTVLRDLDAVLNGARVTGDLTIGANGPVPTVRGDLAFEYVDASEMLAVIAGDASGAVFDAGTDVDTLLAQEYGPPVLPDNDVEIGLKADWMFLPVGDQAVTDLSSTFIYRDNEMTLRDLKASFDGGTVTGQASMRNDGGLVSMTSQLTANGLAIAKLVPETAAAIDGKTGIALQLTGSGRSDEALLTSLAGNGVLSSGPLTVTGLRTDGFAPMIAAADAIGYTIRPEQTVEIARDAFLTGTTVLPAADYPFSVASGEFRLTSATVEAGRLSVAADATVSLTSGDLSGRARLSYDPGDEATAGPQPEVTVSFRSNGEGGLETTTDFEAVTGYLTQRALEREQARVEAQQARLLEKQRLRREVRLFEYRKRTRLDAVRKKEAEARAKDDALRRAAAAKLVARDLEAASPLRDGSAPKIVDIAPVR